MHEDPNFGCDLPLSSECGNTWEPNWLVRKVGYTWGNFARDLVLVDEIDLVPIREGWLGVLIHSAHGNFTVALDRIASDEGSPDMTFVDPTPLAEVQLDPSQTIEGVLSLGRLIPPLPACARLRLSVDGGEPDGPWDATLSVVLLSAPADPGEDDEEECGCRAK